MHRPQVASRILMIRPTTFGFNAQAAETNIYMHASSLAETAIRDAALEEFDAMVAALRAHDIDVSVWDDVPPKPLPDAVFPNNWLSVWSDGTVFLYPMGPPNRRGERRSEIIKSCLPGVKVVDLSATEEHGGFLEGTGAIVFDHDNKVAYAALSERCDQELLEKHASLLGYRPVVFRTDYKGMPVYHTNVVLAVQPTTAILCAEVIQDSTELRKVRKALSRTHTVVEITTAQLVAFCANVLVVANKRGQHFLVLSQTAYDAFSEQQRTILGKTAQLLPVSIPTIERVGGGSARCMLAEM